MWLHYGEHLYEMRSIITKIIVFESVYSMCSSIGPIKETYDLGE